MLSPKQRIKLAVAILTGEMDEADLPPEALKVQHQRPPAIQTRENWFPTEEQLRQQRRKAMHDRQKAKREED